MDNISFSPGQIIGIECHNFRGIEHVTVSALPTVNYFIAPNGSGKTTILYAVALCLGSDLPELKVLDSLIRENHGSSCVMIAICTSANLPIETAHNLFSSITDAFDEQSYNYILPRAKLRALTAHVFIVSISLQRGRQMQVYTNGQLTRQDLLRNVIQKRFEIRIDNPFQSMMQTNAQRLTLMTPSERLVKFIDLIFPEVAPVLDSLRPTVASLVNIYQSEEKAYTMSYNTARDEFRNAAKEMKSLVELGSLQRSVELSEQVLYILEFLDVNTQRTEVLHKYNLLMNDLKAKEARLDEVRKEVRQRQMEKKRENSIAEQHISEIRNTISHLERISRVIKTNSGKLINLQSDYDQLKKQMENPHNEIQLSLQHQQNLLTTEITHIESTIADFETKKSEALAELCSINQNTVSVNSSLEYKQLKIKENELKMEEQAKEQAISYFQNKNIHLYPWLKDIYNQSLLLERESTSMCNFLIVPIISWIGIKHDTSIPQKIVQFILESTVGSSFYTILTNSVQLQNEISKRFGQYRNNGGASSIDLLSDYANMNYWEAHKRAEEELSAQMSALKKRQIHQAGISALSSASAKASVVFLVECLDGNPIVLNYLFPRLSSAIYIQFSSGTSLTADEITNLMHNNGTVFKTLFHNNMLHTGKYDDKNRLLARHSRGFNINSQRPEIIQLYTQNMKNPRFMHEIIADRKEVERNIKDLFESYSDRQQALKSREKELKEFINENETTELNKKLRLLRSNHGEITNKLKSCKVITEQDVLAAEKLCTSMSNRIGTLTVVALSQGRALLDDYYLLAPLIIKIRSLQKQSAALEGELTTLQDEYQVTRKDVDIFQGNTLAKSVSLFKEKKARVLPILNELFPDMAPNPPADQVCDASPLAKTLAHLSSNSHLMKELSVYARSLKSNTTHINFADVSSIDISYFKDFITYLRGRFKLRFSRQDHTVRETIIKARELLCGAFSSQLVSNMLLIHHILYLLRIIDIFKTEVVEIVKGVSGKFKENMTAFGISGEVVLTGLLTSANERENASLVTQLEDSRTFLQKMDEDCCACFDAESLIDALIRNSSLKLATIKSLNNSSETNPYVAFIMAQSNLTDSTTVSESMEEQDSEDTELVEPFQKRTVDSTRQQAIKEAPFLLEKIAALLGKIKTKLLPDKLTSIDSLCNESDNNATDYLLEVHRKSVNNINHQKINTANSKAAKTVSPTNPNILTLDLDSSEVKSAQNTIYDFLFQELTEQQLLSLSEAFLPIVKSVQIQALIPLLLSINPGLEVRTQFVANETLTGVSLSGGESSVVSLCLVNSLYGQKALSSIRFRLVDEINQGLDDKFEEVAHNMLCSVQDTEIQYFIGSPKLPSYLKFEDPRVRVHIIIRRPLLKDISDIPRPEAGPNGGVVLSGFCTEDLY